MLILSHKVSDWTDDYGQPDQSPALHQKPKQTALNKVWTNLIHISRGTLFCKGQSKVGKKIKADLTNIYWPTAPWQEPCWMFSYILTHQIFMIILPGDRYFTESKMTTYIVYDWLTLDYFILLYHFIYEYIRMNFEKITAVKK